MVHTRSQSKITNSVECITPTLTPAPITPTLTPAPITPTKVYCPNYEEEYVNCIIPHLIDLMFPPGGGCRDQAEFAVLSDLQYTTYWIGTCAQQAQQAQQAPIIKHPKADLMVTLPSQLCAQLTHPNRHNIPCLYGIFGDVRPESNVLALNNQVTYYTSEVTTFEGHVTRQSNMYNVGRFYIVETYIKLTSDINIKLFYITCIG